MDIHSVKITQQDVDRILAQATPAQPMGIIGDTCSIYRDIRPIIGIATAVLSYVYPPGASALATVTAIMDKACEPVTTATPSPG